MNTNPADDSLDRLNAWRDGASDEVPPSPELRQQLEAAELQLKQAFDPARAQQFVFGKLHDLIAEEQTKSERSDVRTPTRARPKSLLRWMSMAAASLVVGMIVIYAVTRKPKFNATQYAAATPLMAYDNAVANGMKPAWVCTAAEAPDIISKHFDGLPFAFAAMPTDVSFLGWTGPYRTQQQVLEARELVLFAKVADQPAILVIARVDEASAPPKEATRPGVYVHTERHADYVLIETSPFTKPRLLPLVKVR
jgi:hypothetical protein